MLKHPLFLSLTAFSVLISFAQSGLASQKELIDSAITVNITPRGQNYLSSDFLKILEKNGFALDEGTLPQWKYVASEAIDLDHLPMNMNGYKTTLGQLRDLIQKWFIGFRLKDPKLTVLVKGIHYDAKISHFGLRVNPQATGKLNKENAVIVDLEVEIPRLSVSVNRISVTDSNNPELKTMAMNSLKAHMVSSMNAKKGKAQTLKFRVPLEVKLNAQNGLTVNALPIQSNLSLIKLDWNYVRPLVLPDIEISVNGAAPMKVNCTEFENELAARRAELSKALLAYLKGFLNEHGSSIVDNMLNTNKFSKVIDEVSTIAPPSAPTANVPQLHWGFVPTGLEVHKNSLNATLTTYVEDPKAPRVIALPSDRARGAPDLSAYSPDTYDLAVTVDEQMINRMLQHSFGRGYYTNYLSVGERITLLEAPSFDVDPSLGNPNLVRLHISLAQVYKPTSTWERIQAAIAVKNPVRVNFDVIARLQMIPEKHQLVIGMDHIDLGTVKLDPRSVKAGMFFNTVLKKTMDKITAINQSIAGKNPPLAEPFELPRAIYGIPINVKTFQADSTGHFNIFAEVK